MRSVAVGRIEVFNSLYYFIFPVFFAQLNELYLFSKVFRGDHVIIMSTFELFVRFYSLIGKDYPAFEAEVISIALES